MKRIAILILCLQALWLAVACQPPAVTTPVAPSQATKAAPVSKPAGEWETTMQAAKTEGTVVIYTLWRPETRIMLTQAFKDRFGIELEFVPFGRGAEMLARVQAQKVADLNIVDVLGGGAGTLLSFKKEGLLGAPLEPLLILPESKDPAAWRGGQLPWLDKEKRTIGLVATPQRRILYNTNLVKEGEITSYQDLLKPQYRGKITLNDPTVTGAGVGWFADLARDLWNVEQASEYLVQLIKNEVVIVRDNRIHAESVARGKYAVGIAPLSDLTAEFINLGAPINVVFLKEGVLVAPGAGALGLAPNPPHPNATTVFLNWLLTKEGQTLFSVKGFGNPSFRIDVPLEGIPPPFMLRPDEKFWIDTEELNIFRSEMLEVSKRVIERAMAK